MEFVNPRPKEMDRVTDIGRYSLILGILLITQLTLLAQSKPLSQSPVKDRRKNFGKSLDRFKQKPADRSIHKVDSPDDDVIRVATNMVVTDVLVVNQKGKALLGLKKDDFVITENGVPQDMELFSDGVK